MGFYEVLQMELFKLSRNHSKRNSSVELLRILSILGVVILHYNNKDIGGGFKYAINGSVNQLYLFFSESVFIGAVNLFLMISAYFLSTVQKRSFSKIIELLFQVSFFNIAVYCARIVLKLDTFSPETFFVNLLPGNYFVILYIAVYVISPYINILINKLNKKQFDKLLVTILIVFSLWTIIWDYFNSFTEVSVSSLSTISMYGTMGGYTIVNFCMAYLIGAYIRKYPITISLPKLILCFVIIVFAIFTLSLAENFWGTGKTATYNYNNPLVLGIAACSLLIFLRFHFSSKVINEIARATFTCYLVHQTILKKFNIVDAVKGEIWMLVIHQALVALACFAISYVVYKIYSICVFWLFKFLKPFLDKLDISVC